MTLPLVTRLMRTSTPGFTSDGQRLSFAHPASKVMTKKTKTVLLIDGDVLVYQIGLAAEREIDWGDDVWTLHANFAECRDALTRKVASFIEALQADSAIFALSCPTPEGFRRAVCPTYKSNRNNVRKPIVHQALRQLLIDDYDTIIRDRLEADDVLGVLATMPVPGERRIIVSVDKDFSGVPCLFFRTNTDESSVVEITPDSARRFHAIQTLTGDRVDGYVGIPGCGPKTAEKIIAGVATDDLWPVIVKAYADAGLGEELALTNARLARILQHGDYNTKTGAIKLWTPPSLPSRKTSPATSSSVATPSAATTSSPNATESSSGQTPSVPPSSTKRRTRKVDSPATASIDSAKSPVTSTTSP